MLALEPSSRALRLEPDPTLVPRALHMIGSVVRVGVQGSAVGLGGMV
jgi:hypothetical protein